MTMGDLERALKARDRRRTFRLLWKLSIPIGLGLLLSALFYLYLKGQ